MEILFYFKSYRTKLEKESKSSFISEQNVRFFLNLYHLEYLKTHFLELCFITKHLLMGGF